MRWPASAGLGPCPRHSDACIRENAWVLGRERGSYTGCAHQALLILGRIILCPPTAGTVPPGLSTLLRRGLSARTHLNASPGNISIRAELLKDALRHVP